jgi:hypothetical protein
MNSFSPGLIMTCSAVGQFGAFLMQERRNLRIIRRIVQCIIFGSGFMTFQTEAHIEYLWVLSNFNLGHIPMTGLTVQPCSNVWTVRKVYKIWHLRYRNPLNRTVILYMIDQDGKLFARECLFDLLVAPPAFTLRWQTWRNTPQRTRMTIQTLDLKSYVEVVRKLDRLCGWSLGDRNSISGKTEKCKCPNDDRDPPHWTHRPFKKSLDHAFSSERVVREIMHEIILQSAAELSRIEAYAAAQPVNQSVNLLMGYAANQILFINVHPKNVAEDKPHAPNRTLLFRELTLNG